MNNTKFYIFSLTSFISVIILRCIQILFLIEPKTGFFKYELETLGTITTFLVIAVSVFTAFLGFIHKDITVKNLNRYSSFVGACAIFMGIAHLVEPFTTALDSSAVPLYMRILKIFFIILTGFVLVYFGFCRLTRRHFAPALFVVPIFTWVIRLMSTFISFNGMSYISENLFDILMLCSVLLFMLFYGKSMCRIRQKYCSRLTLAFGIAAVFFTSASVIPSTIISLTGSMTLYHTTLDNHSTCIFTAVFILSVVLSLVGGMKKSEKV